MASIRIVHSAAPADAPKEDLHVWTPPAFGTLATPVPISDALAEFMGLPTGAEVSNAEIIRFLIKYTKERNLLDRWNINADEKLTALLELEPTTQLTILNINKYLRKLYTPHHCVIFRTWWAERDQPLWVGVNLDPVRQYEAIYQLFSDDAYKNLKVVIYADVQWDDAAGEGPCGCGDVTPCDYHRHGEGDAAECGCSEEYKIKCPYHAELTADAE